MRNNNSSNSSSKSKHNNSAKRTTPHLLIPAGTTLASIMDREMNSLRHHHLNSSYDTRHLISSWLRLRLKRDPATSQVGTVLLDHMPSRNRARPYTPPRSTTAKLESERRAPLLAR